MQTKIPDGVDLSANTDNTGGMSANTDTFTAGLAGAVRAEMGRRKLPLHKLKEPLGLSWPTISGRLNGHTPFTSDEIDSIATFLGMSAYELISSADPRRSAQPADESVWVAPVRDVWEQPARSKARRRA